MLFSIYFDGTGNDKTGQSLDPILTKFIFVIVTTNPKFVISIEVRETNILYTLNTKEKISKNT